MLAFDLSGRARRVRSATTLTVTAVAVALLASACEDATTATVQRVVDGDTIDVVVDGGERRVRLLNIDTPESVDPASPVECLGPEAAQFLTEMLPAGTEVTLVYDATRTDRYGRDLAGVFLEDTLVNAEIARAGLASTLVVGGNDRFYDDVEEARSEAEAAKIGLYADNVPCTAAAQVAAYEQQVVQALASAPAPGAALADVHAYGEVLATLAVAGAALDTVLEGGGGAGLYVPRDVRRTLVERRDRSVASVEGARDRQRASRVAEEERLAAAEAARLAEERRIAEEREAARVAAAEEAARAEAERRAAQGAQDSGGSRSGSGGAPSTPVPEQPQAPPAGGGYDGYTGCRAYGKGGTSVDEKGRPYTKIDCTTKLPIG